MERRLAAVVAADMVGYSRFMGVDEAGTLAALNGVRIDVIEPEIAEHHGRVVKLTGDGMLVEFPSVVNALACAVQVQRGMHERNLNTAQERRFEFRIGLHLGDVIAEGEDIFGDGVNVAVRLENLAHPGGIAISESVRDHVGNRLGLMFEDMGEQRLKNIEKPIRVYTVCMENSAHDNMLDARLQAQRPSIAVLPFNNMSGDPEQEYFSDGITEDIITDLSKISGLRVIARHTAFTYKNKSIKVQQIGKELGVGFILEGSVRKAGTRVRVTGQLVSCTDGGHSWAERFDRDLTDIFAIQDEITHAIVDQLKVKLLPQEKTSLDQVPTENTEAYTYYLRGREFFHRWSKPYFELARSMFKKAVELDPGYANAYAGIAACDAHLVSSYHAEIPVEAILGTAAKALALDPRLAEAYASRGAALAAAQRFDEAKAEYERAIALNPESFEAHYFYARSSFATGDAEAAVRLFERAVQIRPDDYQSACLLAQTYKALGREREAETIARRAIVLAEQALNRNPEDARAAQFGAAVLIDLGENERAREWTARAMAIEPDDLVAQYNAACAYCKLGDVEPALDLLETCLPKFGSEKMNWSRYDPDLARIREHPRFKQLLKRFA
jgi:adenylate cyclase